MFLEKVYSGKNQWYYYVFVLLLILVAWQVIGAIPLSIYLLINHPEVFTTGNMSAATSTNTGLALTLLSFAAGFLAIFLCIKYIQGKKYLDIVTARRKTDWGRILFGAGIWALLVIITFFLQMQISNDSNIVFQFEPSKFFPLLIVVLLLMPFQCAFEELLFRGYLNQWAAYLIKYRWGAWIITSVTFGFMHGINPEIDYYGMGIAMPQYILMGLILGYVAIKDDGLELAIGLHIGNNVLSAVTFTSEASALQTHALFKDLNPSASHLDTLVMLITGVLFIAICNYKYKFIHKINLWGKIEEEKAIQE